MDRAHVFFVVLLNLFSVQLTFCGTGELMAFLTPSIRSMGAQPFIQAQFHPASGTIQQGIMLPQDHMVPVDRVPEELYYQERVVPGEKMFHDERVMPQQHFLPQEFTDKQEPMIPSETGISERRLLSPTQMPQVRITQDTMDQMTSQNTLKSPKHTISSQSTQQELGMQERFIQENMKPQERMVSQENIQRISHTNGPHNHLQKQNEMSSDKQLKEEPRAVKGGYEYSHPSYPQSPYGYSPPRPSSTPYSPPSSPYTPPAAEHHEPPTKELIKPDLSELIKPVTGKIAGKLNGLVGLLSLFGSGKGLELGGLKDLLFEGILKPLLAAKGGLKALISKLAIPVIALILINVEVLITVWWLWEDCPEVKPIEYAKPSYTAAPPSYNSYR